MSKFEERQTELLCYLNDNMVDPSEQNRCIAEIFDISFIWTDSEDGWHIDED